MTHSKILNNISVGTKNTSWINYLFVLMVITMMMSVAPIDAKENIKPFSYNITTISGLGMPSEQKASEAYIGSVSSMAFMERNEKGELVEDIIIIDGYNSAIKRLTFTKNDRNEYIPSMVKILAGNTLDNSFSNSKKSSKLVNPKHLTVSSTERGAEIYFVDDNVIKKIDRNGNVQLVLSGKTDMFINCDDVSFDKASFKFISDMKYLKEGKEEVLYIVDNNSVILRASLTNRNIKPITKCKKTHEHDTPDIDSIFVTQKDNEVVIFVADGNFVKKMENGTFSIIAGMKEYNDTSVSQNALDSFITPHAIYVNGKGEVVFNDISSSKLKKIDRNGMIVTLTSDLNIPFELVIESPLTGNIYFGVTQNVYKINNNQMISLFGNGKLIYLGDGGKAIQSKMNPVSIQVSSKSGKDIISVVDSFKYLKMRIIDENQIIQTVIGTNGITNGIDPVEIDQLSANSITLKKSGNIIRSNKGDIHLIYGTSIYKLNSEGFLNRTVGTRSKFGGDGSSAISSLLNEPLGVFYSKESSKTYIADTKNRRIRVISKDGIISTLTGKFGSIYQSNIDEPRDVMERNGALYYVSRGNIGKFNLSSLEHTILVGKGQLGFTEDGKKGIETSVNYPESLYVHENGDIYYADMSNHLVRKWDAKLDVVSTIAGSGIKGSSDIENITAVEADIDSPSGVYLNSKGEVFFVEGGSYKIRKVSLDGILSTVFQVRLAHRVIVSSKDEVFVSHDGFITKYSNKTLTGVAGSRMKSYSIYDDDPFETHFGSITGLSFGETESDIFFTNPKFDRVRKITSGSLSTIAGGNGDGLPASQAKFGEISSMVPGPNNELFISDHRDHTIRKVSSDGMVTNVAGISGINGYNRYDPEESILNGPSTLAITSKGDLFFIDEKNYVIRKISNGVVSTIIGTPMERCDLVEGKKGSETCLSMPRGLSVSPKGDALVFADLSTWGVYHYKLNDENAIVRKIAGFQQAYGYNGDGEASTVLISQVPSVAYSNDGLSIYFVDESNNMIRKLSPYCPKGYELSNQLQQCVENIVDNPPTSSSPKPETPILTEQNTLAENLILILVTVVTVLILGVILTIAAYYLLKNRESTLYYQKVEREEVDSLEDHTEESTDQGKYSLGNDLELDLEEDDTEMV